MLSLDAFVEFQELKWYRNSKLQGKLHILNPESKT